LPVIQFSVPSAVPKGRPKFGRGRTYTPAKTTKAEKAVRDAYRGECVRRFGHVLTAPERAKVTVAVTFEMPAPKTRPKWCPKLIWDFGFVPFVTVPDVDNLTKTVLDGLNPFKDKDGTKVPVAWHDDSQVVEIHAYKLDKRRDGTERTCVTVFWDEENGERNGTEVQQGNSANQ